MKTSLGQLSLKYIGPQIWSDIPKNLKSLALFNWKTLKKTPCYPAEIPVDFRFKCLSLFRNIALVPVFSLKSFTFTVARPKPPVHRHVFPLCFLWLLFCLLFLSDADSMDFVTCETSSIKNLFMLSTGLAEQLTYMVFR